MVYTYSEARQNFSKILDEVEISGKVLIRRKDGRVYELTSAKLKRSPLDVPSIKAEITTDEIVSLIRKGRDKGRTSA